MTEFCFAPGLSLQEIEDAVHALAPGLLPVRPIAVAGGPYANDPRQIVFASASMLDLFGAADLDDLGARLFATAGSGSARLGVLVETLPIGGEAHVESLAFARGGTTSTTTLLCRRIGGSGSQPLFLVATLEANEPAGSPIFLRPSGVPTAPGDPPARPNGAGAVASPDSDHAAEPAPWLAEESSPANASEDAPEEDEPQAREPSSGWTSSDQEIFDAIAASLGASSNTFAAVAAPAPASPVEEQSADPPVDAATSAPVLDLLPIGVCVFRGAVPIFANRFALELLGFDDVSRAFVAGALGAITQRLPTLTADPEPVELRPRHGGPVRASASARSIRWGRRDATLVTLQPAASGDPPHGHDLGGASPNVTESHFLAKVSHEIRTPLSAILGFAEVILEERFGPLGNERYRGYLKDIHASSSLALSLVDDILDLSKAEAGEPELVLAPVDANRIVTECVSMMRPQASRERVVLRLALSPRLPPVLADERSLRQIALNLLSNAVKFNRPGGQVIVATTPTDTGRSLLRIRDTGIGMSEDEVEIALQPFRRLETARARSGTGLGLPLTKALAEANRALFSIKSKKHEGTLVEVAFAPGRAGAE